MSSHLCHSPEFPLFPSTEDLVDAATPFNTVASRREELLAVAANLFAERGYQSVSIDDIGAAANMTGPSLYHHFASKTEILAAILRRAVDWIEYDRVRALRSTDNPEGVLISLVHHYTTLAVTHRELFLIFTHERIHLPDDERRSLDRSHQQFFSEWISLVRATRPELSEAVAHVLVSSAMCIINDLSQSGSLRESPDREARIAHLAIRALHTPAD